MPILAAIMTALQLAAPVAEHLIDKEKINKWIDLGVQAAQGIPAAVEAIAKLKEWAASGYSPTNEELDAVYAASQAVHDQIQSA